MEAQVKKLFGIAFFCFPLLSGCKPINRLCHDNITESGVRGTYQMTIAPTGQVYVLDTQKGFLFVLDPKTTKWTLHNLKDMEENDPLGIRDNDHEIMKAVSSELNKRTVIRFNELIKSGMTEDAAHKQLAKEGF
jgi:hypothetical protein